MKAKIIHEQFYDNGWLVKVMYNDRIYCGVGLSIVEAEYDAINEAKRSDKKSHHTKKSQS